MGSATTVYEDIILDTVFGDDHGTLIPTLLYVALFTAEPNDGGGGTEVVGNDYARVEVENITDNWPNAESGEKRNGTTIDFPQATGEWGDINWWGIFDAAESGNLILWGNLQNTTTPTAGNQPFFDVGGIVIRLD